MDEISLELPLKSEPVILQHITAYKLYKEMDKEKKKLMAGYKSVKVHKKELESQFNSQKVKALERKSSRNRRMGKTKAIREKEKLELQKWKQDKMVNRVLEQERERDLQQHLREKRIRKRQKELDQKKLLVEEYKQMKQMEKHRQQMLE
jgi:hypothetical protein